MTFVLAIDQGTTSTRAILFDANLKAHAVAQEEFTQHFPASGWVEHDPTDLWDTTVRTCREVLRTSGVSLADVAAIGITNQRETTLVWDRETGEPIHNAIVWQDRRTADFCGQLKEQGLEPLATEKTGLLLDPYFSGTKLSWLLDNVDGARARAEAGELMFGTVDTWLIWHLTGGKRHVTDATNAARTLMYDIRADRWSSTMCDMLNVPKDMLPDVLDCAAEFGETDEALFGRSIPILGVAGDQQAATIGQACFEPGMLKSTYGTGCFALLNTGRHAVTSQNRLLTTIAYRMEGEVTYALEGSIFVAGAVVQWLRDGLGIIASAGETQKMAEAADPTQNIYLVPAFTGMGAPYWNPNTRGAVFGLTRNSGPNEFAKAALESVGYQTLDLLEAMQADMGGKGKAALRVDGGMSASDYAMQFLADITGAEVDRPDVLETTAMGAAWLAGQKAGIYPAMAEFAATWSLERRFTPDMDAELRAEKRDGWKRAVNAALAV